MTDAFRDLPPEALLRQTAWLDALARGLVADADRAQDAVQDAWVAALRHRGSIGQLGPWLAQVVRRLASRQRRRETSRADREAEAARAEAQPSAADVVARVQQQHRVVAAVLALDEPFRATVLMRFFDGLPPRRIAERMQVPVATVRTRLQRALARLRTILDQEGCSRRAWLAPLLTGIAARRGAAAFLPGLLMKTKLVASAALAAVGLLVTLVWIGGEPPASVPPAGQPAAAGQMVVAERPATPAPGQTPLAVDVVRSALAERAPDAVPAPTASELLTGTVVDGDGRPVAGAEVAAVERLGAGFNILAESREAEERGRDTTDARGHFRLDVPFARELCLQVWAKGFARRSLEPCYAGEHRTIVLRAGASLVGRITDAATGDPVPDVVLDGWYRGSFADQVEGRSGADGTFRIDDIPSGDLVLDVTPPQHERQLRQHVVLRAGERTRFDVALRAGGTVFGSVTDAASGQPIRDAEISAGWTFEKVVRTDAAGNYRMRGAPGPGVPDMHARARGYAAAAHEVRGDGEQRVDFALHRGGSVRGRIVDAAGRPQAGVYVAVNAEAPPVNGIGRTEWQFAHSGDDGMFRIVGLRPGAEYMLFVRQRGRATQAIYLPGQIDPYRELDAGDVMLRDPAVLLGRVVDQHGVGIPDASVDLRGSDDDSARLLDPDERARRQPPYHAVNRDTRTDGNGWFRFADLAAGTYHLSASVRGGPEGERDGVRVEAGRTTSGVDIPLDLGRAIAGVVGTDDGSQLDAEHVAVTITAADDEDLHRWVQVQRDGSFRVVGLDEGRYVVQVSISHWANDELSPWLGSEIGDVAAGREDLRLVLHRAAVITGKVVDAAGLPRKGVAVTAVGPGIDHQGARDLTRDDGAFRLLVMPGTVCDLRYGGSPDPMTGKAPEYRGVTAGTTGLVLVLE